MTFEVIMSAAAFAQFKRHRMTSITWNPYDPDLGLTVPKAITDAGLQDELLLINNKATKLANKMGMKHPATPYVWTNAHRRRVLITLNLREMYHMSRLREDESAQWDIRQLVGQMSELARQVFPICAGFLGGKDQFPK
jgi:thymidylate synthase ThyX